MSGIFEVSASMTTSDAYEIIDFISKFNENNEKDFKKLITTGLIDPNKCFWGIEKCRYLKGLSKSYNNF